jgi:ribosomal protein S18 acetylase RimI-like enzyme
MVQPASLQDFDFFYELYMHPAINPYLLYENMSAAEFRPIFDSLLNQEALFVYYADAVPAGMFKLIPQKYRNDHIIYLGGLAIVPAFSGRGQGHKMMNEIIAFARESGFLRIELSVASTNDKAIQLYEKVGFQKEGLLKKYTHLKSEQRFIDEFMMALVF